MTKNTAPAAPVADKSRAEVLADWHDSAPYVPNSLGHKTAEMLRRIPALEAERDQLRAEVEALRDANSTFATAAILPDDKVIVDKAEIEELRFLEGDLLYWVGRAVSKGNANSDTEEAWERYEAFLNKRNTAA